MAGPDLSKMIGPLPLGAWIAVLSGGLGLALYTRNQNKAEPITDPDLMPEDTGTTPGVGVGGSGQWTNVDPPANGSGDTNSAATNEEWGRNTIIKMMAQGSPPGPTNNGITKFLVEEKLDATEYAIVSEALRKYGAPPIPPKGPYGPGATVPPPTGGGSTRWPVPKAPFFQYTIQSGDTIGVIAAHYGMNKLFLYSLNAPVLDRRAVLTGNKRNSQQGKYIYAGTVINIPWKLPGMKYTP